VVYILTPPFGPEITQISALRTILLTSDRTDSYNHPRLGASLILSVVSRPELALRPHNFTVEVIQTFKEPK